MYRVIVTNRDAVRVTHNVPSYEYAERFADHLVGLTDSSEVSILDEQGYEVYFRYKRDPG